MASKHRTFSRHMKVSNCSKRSAPSGGGRGYRGPARPTGLNMPATIIHKAWLTDGTQVAVARVNDHYIAAHFDAGEKLIDRPAEFHYGGGEARALAWCDAKLREVRGF
jgi:hypothetical protein